MPPGEPARKRRRAAAIALAGAAALLGAAGAPASVTTVPVAVSPATGGPASTFVVSWRSPDRTGIHGSLRRTDQLSASVAHAGSGCVAGAGARAPAAAAGARVSVRLTAAGARGRWCPGRWTGRIEELETPVCKAGLACPQFIVLRGVVGRFSFTVAPAAHFSGPRFAGLISAVACTPGPQRPGETTPFTLRWSAASDPATPPSAIVYEVFEATSPGAEDLAHPTWTTAPGATSFRTPGLPSHGTFFFIVRARDGAGLVDHNTVEQRGVDPCL